MQTGAASMPLVPFIAAVIDDGSREGQQWRSCLAAGFRQAGMTALEGMEEIDRCDVAIVGGASTRATARRALEVAQRTERGSLFAIWTDARSVAVFLAPAGADPVRPTWLRKLLGEPRDGMDASAVECDVLILSAIAMRDGVETSAKVDPFDGYPRVSGRIVFPESDLPTG